MKRQIKFKDGSTANIPSKKAPKQTSAQCDECNTPLMDYESITGYCFKCIRQNKLKPIK